MSRLTRVFALIVLSLTGVLFIVGSGTANAAPASMAYAGTIDDFPCC